jgi:hypothetical protein
MRSLFGLVALAACRVVVDPAPDAALDARSAPVDARRDAAGPDASGDGTPIRQTCTSSFGTGLGFTHGRLDGYLVSIVPPSLVRACNADSHHLHLQVDMDGSVYDVAVNISDTDSPVGIAFLERDHALATPWSEGWHTDAALDYVDLGVHAGDFTPTAQAVVDSRIEADLADVNHISVYMTGYGPDGGHLVHRNLTGEDGAIVLHPLAQTPRFLMFHFATQSF